MKQASNPAKPCPPYRPAREPNPYLYYHPLLGLRLCSSPPSRVWEARDMVRAVVLGKECCCLRQHAPEDISTAILHATAEEQQAQFNLLSALRALEDLETVG